MSIRSSAALLFLWATAVTFVGQMPPQLTRVYGPNDRDLPTPVHLTRAVTDTAALGEVLSFVATTGVTGWLGLTAHGTMTFAGDPVLYPATLSLLGSDKCRLDVSKPLGLESTIYSGSQGLFVSATNERSVVSSDVSVAGLLAFPRLLSADYPLKHSLVSDGGVVSIGGIQLHRVTLDDPSTDGLGSPWKTSDLYFDPTNGTLVQSASFSHLRSSDAAMYMIATTYEDYRRIGAISLPYRFQNKLNGQPQWTLQLTDVDLHALPNLSLFTF